MNVTRQLYNFSGLQFDDIVQRHILELTNGAEKQRGPFDITRPKSFDIITGGKRWTGRLWTRLRILQCAGILWTRWTIRMGPFINDVSFFIDLNRVE